MPPASLSSAGELESGAGARARPAKVDIKDEEDERDVLRHVAVRRA